MRQSTKDKIVLAIVAVALSVAVILVATLMLAYFHSDREVTAKVRNESRSCTSKTCTNLVYTDHGTFKDSDSLLAGKFNSSDVYGQLCPGGVYTFKVRGWRQGLLSMWPNILKVEKVISQPANCQ